MSEIIISGLQTAHCFVEIESKGIKTEKASFQPLAIFKESLNLSYPVDITNFKLVTRAFSIQSELLLEQGTILNSLLLYKDAIEVLTQAIKLNVSNREAYIERAMAYFETNQIQLALADYKKIKHFSSPP